MRTQIVFATQAITPGGMLSTFSRQMTSLRSKNGHPTRFFAIKRQFSYLYCSFNLRPPILRIHDFYKEQNIIKRRKKQ